MNTSTLATDKKRITLSLDDEVYDWLESMAELQNKSKAAVAVEAICTVMAVEPETIKLVLSPEHHAALRKKAAQTFRSEVDAARLAIVRYVLGELETKGIDQ